MRALKRHVGGGDREQAVGRGALDLMAAGEAVLEVQGRRLEVSAELASPTERAQLWPRLLEVWPAYADYQARQDARELPVVIFKPR